jgi:hypothetical protein
VPAVGQDASFENDVHGAGTSVVFRQKHRTHTCQTYGAEPSGRREARARVAMSLPMEIRLARLESAYEQIDRRIASLELRVDSGFARIDQKFNWMFGLIVAMWITTIVTVLFHR